VGEANFGWLRRRRRRRQQSTTVVCAERWQMSNNNRIAINNYRKYVIVSFEWSESRRRCRLPDHSSKCTGQPGQVVYSLGDCHTGRTTDKPWGIPWKPWRSCMPHRCLCPRSSRTTCCCGRHATLPCRSASALKARPTPSTSCPPSTPGKRPYTTRFPSCWSCSRVNIWQIILIIF